jgi:S1-C subfamily serine protease
MSFLRLTLATLLALCPVKSFAQKVDVKTLEQSVVVLGIRTPQDNVALPVGTGFFVGPDTIITAGHVFWQGNQIANGKRSPDGVRMLIPLGDGTQTTLVPVSLVKSDDVHDVALLRFDRKLTEPLNLKVIPLAIADDGLPDMGMDVILFGHFETYNVLMGIKGSVGGYLAVLPTVGNVDELLVSLDANGGFSGGPVISLDSGKVIGLMEGYLPNPFDPSPSAFAKGISRVVRCKYIRALMDSAAAH